MEVLLVAACLALIAIVVAPILKTNYLGDDAFNSYIPGWIGYERLSLPQAYAQLYAATNISSGRFYPLYPALLLSLYGTVRSLSLVKAMQMGAILINAVTFYIFSRRLAGREVALCALAALPLAFEFREFHDAILQFSLHFPLTLELVLLALLCAQRYIAGGPSLALIGTAACWSLAAMLYDGVYPLALTFFALSGSSRFRNRGIWLSALVGGIVIVFGAVASVQRLTQPTFAAGYHASFGTGAITTYLAQVAAAIPLNYYLANPNGFFPGITALWENAGTLGALKASLSFALALGIFAVCARGRRHDRVDARLTIVIAASLWLLPAVLIAIASRYQQEIRFGLGHTPVYIEAYGFALAAGVLLAEAFRRWSVALVVGAVGYAFVYGTNVAANAQTLLRYGGWDHPRRVLSAALRFGVLPAAPSGAVLYVDHSTPINDQYGQGNWDPRYFYFQETGRRYDVRPLEREATDVIALGSLDLRVFAPHGSSGDVIASRLRATSAPNSFPTIDGANVFEQTVGSRRPLYAAQRFASRDMRVVAASPEQTLFSFASACHELPVEALPDNSPAPVALLWGPGFFTVERDAGASWHWAGTTSTLQLATRAKQRLHVALHLQLLDANPARARADINFGTGQISTPISPTRRAVTLTLGISAERPGIIHFQTSAPRAVSPGDTRDLHMQVRNAYVSGDC